MKPVFRLVLSYTTWNIALVLVAFGMPVEEWLRDFARANSLLIAAAISYIWITGHAFRVRAAMFASYSALRVRPAYRDAFMLLIDLTFHFLPVILVGLPRQPESVLVALAVMMVWMTAVRRRIHEIYVPDIDVDALMLWTAGAAVGFMMWKKIMNA